MTEITILTTSSVSYFLRCKYYKWIFFEYEAVYTIILSVYFNFRCFYRTLITHDEYAY